MKGKKALTLLYMYDFNQSIDMWFNEWIGVWISNFINLCFDYHIMKFHNKLMDLTLNFEMSS